MKLFIQYTARHALTDFLDFNEIDYQRVETWNSKTRLHDISGVAGSNNLLVIDSQVFNDLVTFSIQQVIDFCQTNRLMVWQDIDSLAEFLKVVEQLENIDQQIPPHSLVYYLDGRPCVTPRLTNVQIEYLPYNFFMRSLSRIPGADTSKNDNARAFMVMTVIKPGRPHREMLAELLQDPILQEHGHLVIHDTRDDPGFADWKTRWVGGLPRPGHVNEVPPPCLYRDSFFDIVPETIGQHGWFFTEKTGRAISAFTPFLSVTAPGYLAYLKSLGFETFHSVIDESYDLEFDLTARVIKVVKALRDVIDGDARDCYHACDSIIKHNHQRLQEIAGGWTYHMDKFLQNQLEKYG